MKKILLAMTALVLGTVLMAQDASNGIQWAVVDISTSYIRVSPDYESGLDSQVLMGVPVQVDAHERYWDHITAMEPRYTGWVTNMGLAYMTEAQKDEWIAAPKYICTAEYSHIYTSPSYDADRIGDFTMGNLVRQMPERCRGWLQVALPSGRKGWVPAVDVSDFAAWAETRRPNPESVIAVARKMLGTPYLWGGMSVKGTDCSGLMRTAFFMNGILLPRDARQQYLTGETLPAGADLSVYKPGDLLFFGFKASGKKPIRITHVAMYIGDGKIIHSSLKVRISSLLPGGDDFYDREIIAACRVLGNVDKGKGIISIGKSPYYFKQ